jgi:hypothetical protein
MTIADVNGNKISVGNRSSPPTNHAVIKSFKYGNTTAGGGGGYRMEIEVADEAGGSFATFMNRMVSVFDVSRMQGKNWVHVQWGWIGGKCPGDTYFPSTSHTALLLRINSTFAHGLMKFNLEATDITTVAFQATTNDNYGKDDQPIPLKQAITQLCQKYGVKVEFLRPNTLEEWNFSDPATNGGRGDSSFPKDVVRTNSQDFVTIICNWIANAGVKTDRGHGIVPAFNSRREPGNETDHLILWENPVPKCGEVVDGCKFSLGTYIVNGGKESSVLSFNPQIEPIFGHQNESGGGSSTTKNEQKNEKGDPECNYGPQDGPKRGQPTYNVNTDNANRIYGTLLGYQKSRDAQVAHARAAIPFKPIKCELKIQGDPSLADPVQLNGKFVSLVVVNPYHIQAGVDGDCGDWLQADPCNVVASNKNWMIMGSYHEVKEGSYTTTLQLSLANPGSDISFGMPLGASPNGFIVNS